MIHKTHVDTELLWKFDDPAGDFQLERKIGGGHGHGNL
jgi:hypothetical protein